VRLGLGSVLGLVVSLLSSQVREGLGSFGSWGFFRLLTAFLPVDWPVLLRAIWLLFGLHLGLFCLPLRCELEALSVLHSGLVLIKVSN
jgi:hypothetical protein